MCMRHLYVFYIYIYMSVLHEYVRVCLCECLSLCEVFSFTSLMLSPHWTWNLFVNVTTTAFDTDLTSLMHKQQKYKGTSRVQHRVLITTSEPAWTHMSKWSLSPSVIPVSSYPSHYFRLLDYFWNQRQELFRLALHTGFTFQHLQGLYSGPASQWLQLPTGWKLSPCCVRCF